MVAFLGTICLTTSESLTLHPPRITCDTSFFFPNCISLLYLLNKIALGMNTQKKKNQQNVTISGT